jgi:RNA polymerase sigma-70 factor (ECF subfamily)
MTGRFSTWLWRIALNLCHDELRRRNRRKEFLIDGMEGDDGSALEMMAVDEVTPDSRVVAQEEGMLVRQALLRLPEIYRTVLVLRHYESLKITKIAEVLEIPEGTVNSRLAEALARLSRLLEPQLAQDRGSRTEARKQIQPKELLVI